MSGEFALGPTARCNRPDILEGLIAQGAHHFAVEIAARVHVHLVVQKLVARRRGGDLDCGHERKVGHRSVACNEQEQIASTSGLAGDAFEIVTGAVHEIESRFLHSPGVIGHEIEPRERRFLGRGSEGFERDVVEAPQLVAGGGIPFRRASMPGKPRLKTLDGGEKTSRGIHIPGTMENVSLGANELVGLRQTHPAAMTDDLMADRTRKRIARDAGKGVGSAALKRRAQAGQRFLRALDFRDTGEPGSNLLLRPQHRRRQ